MIRTLEGIVIRQTKIAGGRRMITIFTREEGKISAGTRISEKSRGGAALAIRPFTLGHYTISGKTVELGTITSAETASAFFALGEDADRFAEASFALEFTDKLLPDGAFAGDIFDLLREYLDLLVIRKTHFRLLTISYMIKVMMELGIFPDEASLSAVFSGEDYLPSDTDGDILNVIAFITAQPLKRMDGLALDPQKELVVFSAVRAYAQKHLDLGTMKSERMFRRETRV